MVRENSQAPSAPVEGVQRLAARQGEVPPMAEAARPKEMSQAKAGKRQSVIPSMGQERAPRGHFDNPFAKSDPSLNIASFMKIETFPRVTGFESRKERLMVNVRELRSWLQESIGGLANFSRPALAATSFERDSSGRGL